MKRFLTIAMLVCFASTVFAAGTVTTPSKYAGTVREFRDHQGRLIRWIKWTWTSTAGTATVARSGTVTKATTNNPTDTDSMTHWGKILNIWCDPDADNAPDDNYDIEIQNADGMDMLNGAGQNLSVDDSSSENRITPLGDNGYFRLLYGDTLSFYGENLNSAGTASGGLQMFIEVFEEWF